MLVTRQCDTGRNTWSSSKLEAIYHGTVSPRMSNFESLSTQPDWREQYSVFPLSGENDLGQQSYEASSTSNITEDGKSQATESVRPVLEHRHSLGPLRPDPQPAPIIDRPDSTPGVCGVQGSEAPHDESLVSTESTSLSLGPVSSNYLSPTSSVPVSLGTLANNEEDINIELKEEEDEEDEDDDMLDIEDGSVPQTAAERRAERRKMKRFRLTHQQTRFLMSEFAKQAHPDAAHRERLSREIPGLSPRQVQVWFQNRRAKIKRLTADDRERMMKMRAVPDDFDNVQALHSPYGAVHGIGTPMQSPVDFVSSYGEQMIRPLAVDTLRRHENEEQMSPTGLSPAFGHVGFSQQGSMNTPDGLSPLSLNAGNRYYSSHLSSPMSAGPRSANSFDRQGSYQSLSHPRQHSRALQPLQLRETLTRTRSESLQSPLRSSMSWKGETLDYGSYQTAHPSPQLSGRQQSVYQPDQLGNGAVNAHQFEMNNYTNSSPTSMTYSSSHGGVSASLHQSSPAALSRLPLAIDLRSQYRPMAHQSDPQGVATPRSSTFASGFPGGYASAPLSAPVEFSLPRTPNDPNAGHRDYNIPLLSAPMAPPQDFSSAYNSHISQHRSQQGDGEFGSRRQNGGDNRGQPQQGQGQGQVQLDQQQEHHQHSRSEEASYLRPGYETGQNRKRSHTMPGTLESP